MPLTEEQAKSLLTKAKQQKPNITASEAKALLAEGNKRIDASQPSTEDKKFASWLPGAGQVTGNILGMVYGLGDKNKRIAAGTAGRATGEVVRQAIDPKTSAMGPSLEIIQGLLSGKNINEPVAGREGKYGLNKEQVQQKIIDQNVKPLATETATGLGSEALGEYVVGPAINKGVELAGPTVKAFTENVDNVLTRIFPRGTAFVKGTAKNIGEGISTMLGKNADVAANELYGFDHGTIVRNFNATHPDVNISKSAAELTAKVAGKTREEILQNTVKYSGEVGQQLSKDLASKPKVISIEALRPEIQKKAEQLIKTGEAGSKVAEDLLTQFNSMAGKNLNLDRVAANELKSTLTDQLFTAAGKEKNVAPLSNGTMQAYEMVSKYLRKEVKDGLSKDTAKLFDDYGVLQAMRKGLEYYGGKVSGMPESQFGSTLTNQLFDFLTKGYRDPGYLTAVTQNAGNPAVANQALTGVANLLKTEPGQTVSMSGVKQAGASLINPQLQALQRSLDKRKEYSMSNPKLK